MPTRSSRSEIGEATAMNGQPGWRTPGMWPCHHHPPRRCWLRPWALAVGAATARMTTASNRAACSSHEMSLHLRSSHRDATPDRNAVGPEFSRDAGKSFEGVVCQGGGGAAGHQLGGRPSFPSTLTRRCWYAQWPSRPLRARARGRGSDGPAARGKWGPLCYIPAATGTAAALPWFDRTQQERRSRGKQPSAETCASTR